MIYMTEQTFSKTFYAMQNTLTRLGLIQSGLSVVPQALLDYMVAYCPNMIPWDCNTTSSFNEEDDEQLKALHHLKLFEIEIKFYQTVMELFR